VIYRHAYSYNLGIRGVRPPCIRAAADNCVNPPTVHHVIDIHPPPTVHKSRVATGIPIREGQRPPISIGHCGEPAAREILVRRIYVISTPRIGGGHASYQIEHMALN